MEEKLYYVQDTRQVVGNCALWWGKDRCGYTCEIAKAGLYTRDEVSRMRKTDVAYLASEVDAKVVGHVRQEALRQLAPLDRGE